MKVPSSIKTLRDALLLLLWGVFVLRIAAAGQLSTYLHPSLQPFTIAAGVLLLLLALFAIRGFFRPSPASHGCSHDHGHCHDHGEDHEHSHDEAHSHGETCGHDAHVHRGKIDAIDAYWNKREGEANTHEHEEPGNHGGHDHGEAPVPLVSLLVKTVLLLLPLAMIVSGQGTQFSITTVQNRGIVGNIDNLPAAKARAGALPTQSSGTGAAPTTPATPATDTTASSATSDGSTKAPASGPMPAQIIDLLYAVQMPSYREDFEGKQIELVGQFVPLTTGNPKGDRFQAIRLFITCCAADAKPVGVTIQYPKPLNVPEMGWVKITGIPKFPLEGGRRTAVLEASKVEECPAPNEPFVY